jgi:hypothetical protein
MRFLLALILAGTVWGAADPDLVAFLSPDERFILGFRVEHARGTPLDELIRDTWPSAEWPTWSGIRFEDVVEIAADESVVTARLRAGNSQLNLSRAATRETYRDIILISDSEQADLNTAARVGESILLLGTKEMVKAAIDRSIAKPQFPSATLEEIRRIRSVGQFWAFTNDTSRGSLIDGARSYSASMNQRQDGQIEIEIAALFDSPTTAQAFVRNLSDEDRDGAVISVSGATVQITFQTSSVEEAENIFSIPMLAILDDTQ